MNDQQANRAARMIENALSFIIAVPLAGLIVYTVTWAIIWSAYNLVQWDGLFVHNGRIPFWNIEVFSAGLLIYLVMTVIKRWRRK